MDIDIVLSTECHTPSYGYVNKDGYVRILTKPRKQGGLLKMRHRVIWENNFGLIPDSHEINHICKNRKCCNVEHLECLPRSIHRSKDNHLRYLDREKEVIKYKEENPMKSQKEIGEQFGITKLTVGAIFKRNNVPWKIVHKHRYKYWNH